MLLQRVQNLLVRVSIRITGAAQEITATPVCHGVQERPRSGRITPVVSDAQDVGVEVQARVDHRVLVDVLSIAPWTMIEVSPSSILVTMDQRFLSSGYCAGSAADSTVTVASPT